MSDLHLLLRVFTAWCIQSKYSNSLSEFPTGLDPEKENKQIQNTCDQLCLRGFRRASPEAAAAPAPDPGGSWLTSSISYRRAVPELADPELRRWPWRAPRRTKLVQETVASWLSAVTFAWQRRMEIRAWTSLVVSLGGSLKTNHGRLPCEWFPSLSGGGECCRRRCADRRSTVCANYSYVCSFLFSAVFMGRASSVSVRLLLLGVWVD